MINQILFQPKDRSLFRQGPFGECLPVQIRFPGGMDPMARRTVGYDWQPRPPTYQERVALEIGATYIEGAIVLERRTGRDAIAYVLAAHEGRDTATGVSWQFVVTNDGGRRLGMLWAPQLPGTPVDRQRSLRRVLRALAAPRPTGSVRGPRARRSTSVLRRTAVVDVGAGRRRASARPRPTVPRRDGRH